MEKKTEKLIKTTIKDIVSLLGDLRVETVELRMDPLKLFKEYNLLRNRVNTMFYNELKKYDQTFLDVFEYPMIALGSEILRNPNYFKELESKARNELFQMKLELEKILNNPKKEVNVFGRYTPQIVVIKSNAFIKLNKNGNSRLIGPKNRRNHLFLKKITIAKDVLNYSIDNLYDSIKNDKDEKNITLEDKYKIICNVIRECQKKGLLRGILSKKRVDKDKIQIIWK